MNNQKTTEYKPNYVSPPGVTLSEVIENLRITQTELAERVGRSRKMISEIIDGKGPISVETALQLEIVLGIPAHFWIARESTYRAWLASVK